MSQQQVTELQQNFQAIKQNRWVDKRLAYVLARSFVGSRQHFDGEQFVRLKQLLKSKLGFFHLLQAPLLDAVVTMMMVNGKTTEGDVVDFLNDYQRLVDAGFHRSGFTYFAAFLLTLSPEDKTQAAMRGQQIYQEIKGQHPFLTSSEDAPMAILLALQPYLLKKTPREIAAVTESYYQNLRRAGFSRFADLQYGAACCTNYFGSYQEGIIQRISEILQQLRNHGFSITSSMYISIVTLAYVSLTEPVDYQDILQNEALIKENGGLRFDRGVRQLLAISLYNGKMLRKGQTQTADQIDALNISLMILQEQAAIVAATTTAAVAASSN